MAQLNRKNRRLENEVNAGSMADIAFLLLIFFLVATTIVEDKGILVKLPPWDPNQEAINVNQDNVFTVLINHENGIYAEGEETEIEAIKNSAKLFIETKLLAFQNTEKTPVISITNDRNTAYNTYLGVYNELKAAYRQLWDELSQQLYKKNYEYLSIVQRRDIKKRIPLFISEAEPNDYGG